MPLRSYAHKTAILILITTLIRGFLTTFLELGNDESYYYTYALQPDWNHFDHPPLIGIFIRIFTLNLQWVNDFSMRLPSIVGAAICTWLIFRCGSLLKNQRTGWLAAILYNTSIFTSFASGLLILPDSVQLVFWLWGVYLSLQLILIPTNEKSENYRILLLGVVIGLATMCKVHGVFLWVGLGAFIVLHDRKLLRNPVLYLSVLLTLLIISPIYFWNLHYDFVTWRFHSERVVVQESGVDLGGFLQTLIDMFIYFSPFNVIIYILSLFHLRKTSFPGQSLKLLCWMAFPIIIATLTVSLFRTTLVHWSGPGHVGLMIIAAYVMDDSIDLPKNIYKPFLNLTIASMGIFVILGVTGTNYIPGTTRDSRLPELGKNDITLERYGWNYLRNQFDQIRQTEIREGRMNINSPIILARWYPGCHYLYYIGRPLGIPVIGLGPVDQIHKYAWLNNMQGYISRGDNGYFISTSNYFEDPYELFDEDFERIVYIDRIPLLRSGATVRYWYIYRLEMAVRDMGKYYIDE